MSTDPLIGSLVSGKYVVQQALARGGMGRIYRAEQTPLGREVALKILTQPAMGTEAERLGLEKRFFLEAATCARLRHPNTVTVFDYGSLEIAGDPTFFMVMELVHGRTLAQVLRQEGPLTPARAASVVYEIARSLREAHREGVVHRDLKPSNVMLVDTDEGESVKVLDFGVAKVLAAGTEVLTTDGNFVGSPRYTAPEQIRQEEVDGRADLYALGIVLWELLVGTAPFTSPEPVRTLLMHLNDPLPEFVPRHPVPEGLESVMRKLLEKNAADRYPDADALLDALRGLRSEGAETTLEAPLVQVTERTGAFPKATAAGPAPSRGGSWLAAGVGVSAAALGVLVLGLAALWWAMQGGSGGDVVKDRPLTEVLSEMSGPGTERLPGGGSAPAVVAPQVAVGEPTTAPVARVRLESSPAGAEVWRDGARIGVAPYELEYDPGTAVVVELRAAGHRARTVAIEGVDSDGVIRTELSPTVRKDPPKPSTPSPFGGDDIRLER